MGPRNRAVDTGERQPRLSLRRHMGHDLIPYTANRPTPKAQIRVMPVAELRWDRTPFGPVVEPPDDRFDRAPILGAWTRATNVRRCDRGFKFRPLGIRQNSHLVSPPMPNEIRRVVISASHKMRTGPSSLSLPARAALPDVLGHGRATPAHEENGRSRRAR